MHITTNTFVNKLHVHTYFFLFKIYIMWCVMCMHNNNVRQCSRKNGVYYVHILTLHFPISIYAILKSTTFYILIPSCANLSSHIHTLTHTITHTHTLQHYNKRYYFGNGLLYSISPPSSSPPSYSSKFKPILPPILLDDDDIKLNILSLPLPTLFDKFKN